MNTPTNYLLAAFFVALGAALLLQPLVRQLFITSGWFDRPNHRKVHKKPTPASGGVAIGLTVVLTSLFITPFRMWCLNHLELLAALSALMIMGALDDRHNLPAKLRLFIQFLCAAGIALAGIRLTQLHGILGITQMPGMIQYGLTILFLLLSTNAYNLIDGIDGLAGVLSLMGLLTMGILASLTGLNHWWWIIAPVSGALIGFLKYNWRPALLFMGDSGATTLGFLLGAIAIDLAENAPNAANSPLPLHVILALISGVIIIPVADTLRLFIQRIQANRSPLAADKNHLHHWLLRHYLAHSQATLRLAFLNILVLIVSALVAYWSNIFVVLIVQLAMVSIYTLFLKKIALFHNWYRQLRKMEQLGEG